MSSTTVNVVRLTTGEELIATVGTENTSTRGTVYTLTDVAILIPTEQNSLGLAPFMYYTTASDKGLTLAEKDVMFVTDPVEDLLKQYQNMFSKLMTPNQGIVT